MRVFRHRSHPATNGTASRADWSSDGSGKSPVWVIPECRDNADVMRIHTAGVLDTAFMPSDPVNDSLGNAQRIRLSAMRAEISGRLWRITAGMQSDAYNALIHQMAALQDKYEQRKLLGRW